MLWVAFGEGGNIFWWGRPLGALDCDNVRLLKLLLRKAEKDQHLGGALPSWVCDLCCDSVQSTRLESVGLRNEDIP